MLKRLKLPKFAFSRPSRRNVIKGSSLVIIAGALAAVWALIVWGGHINMKDPAAVATQFAIELQADHPHLAYSLTSDDYQKNIKEADFTNNVARGMTQEIPKTQPQFVDKAVPPPKSKITGQARITLRIAKDGQTGRHTMKILMVENTKNSQWYVQSITLINDEIGAQVNKQKAPAPAALVQ